MPFQELCSAAASFLDSKSCMIEDAVADLSNLLVVKKSPEDDAAHPPAGGKAAAAATTATTSAAAAAAGTPQLGSTATLSRMASAARHSAGGKGRSVWNAGRFARIAIHTAKLLLLTVPELLFLCVHHLCLEWSLLVYT